MPKPVPSLDQPPLTPPSSTSCWRLPMVRCTATRSCRRSTSPPARTMRMGPGTIYGSLQRMEEAGLVRELDARGDDRRRVFALQPAGRRALEAEARAADAARGAGPRQAPRARGGVMRRRLPLVAGDLSLPARAVPARIPRAVRRRSRGRLRANAADARAAAARGCAWSPMCCRSVPLTHARARAAASARRASAYRGETTDGFVAVRLASRRACVW